MWQYEKANEIKDSINGFFVGKESVVENMLICLLAGGHVLLEDVPGIGKTTLAKCFARVIACSFGRIQFTPDTLPGDVVGVSVYNMKTGEFAYQAGAVMNQILLADEINRTSPKTQASLLEAMSENQVTVDGIVYPLPQPFMVIATQNPVEYLGTYPLPEAQMDRFMMKLSIGYPDREQEIKMAAEFLSGKVVFRNKSRVQCGKCGRNQEKGGGGDCQRYRAWLHRGYHKFDKRRKTICDRSQSAGHVSARKSVSGQSIFRRQGLCETG